MGCPTSSERTIFWLFGFLLVPNLLRETGDEECLTVSLVSTRQTAATGHAVTMKATAPRPLRLACAA
jgi:hypothetical protein